MQKKLVKILNIVIVIPLIVLFLFSIFVSYQYDDVLPTDISFVNYSTMLSGGYIKLILSSIVMSFVVSVVATIISYLFVRSLSIHKFKPAVAFKLLSAIPILVPAYSYIIGLGMALNVLRLNDTVIGVLVSHIIVVLPYSIFLLDNSVSLIGEDFEEVGTVFGADEAELIFGISMPMLKQSFINSLAIGFVISFSQYFLTVVIGGGVVKTYAMHIFPLIQGNNRGLAAAAALIFCIINIIVYMALIKDDRIEVNSL